MGMIIIGVVIIGSFFYAYTIYANTGQRRHARRTKVQYEPKVIKLPENIEREKRKRHIR